MFPELALDDGRGASYAVQQVLIAYAHRGLLMTAFVGSSVATAEKGARYRLANMVLAGHTYQQAHEHDTAIQYVDVAVKLSEIGVPSQLPPSDWPKVVL